MILPGLLYLIINNYIPMGGLFIAFKNIDYSKGIFHSDWVGLKNFEFLFRTKDAFVITRNTLMYNFTFILVSTLVGVFAALLFNEIRQKFFVKAYQTLILLPQLISIIIVAYIVYAFLSNETGMINKTILPFFGMKPINFYGVKKYWPFILVITNTWKMLGYTTIIYFAAIIGIDNSLYEAAKIDGASKWNEIKYITLPLLKPTITTLVLMQLGRVFFSDFGLFYQIPMNSGALYQVTNTIDTYVYRSLLQLNNISMASAAGAYQSVVGFIFILIVNGVVRKIDRENALF